MSEWHGDGLQRTWRVRLKASFLVLRRTTALHSRARSAVRWETRRAAWPVGEKTTLSLCAEQVFQREPPLSAVADTQDVHEVVSNDKQNAIQRGAFAVEKLADISSEHGGFRSPGTPLRMLLQRVDGLKQLVIPVKRVKRGLLEQPPKGSFGVLLGSGPMSTRYLLGILAAEFSEGLPRGSPFSSVEGIQTFLDGVDGLRIVGKLHQALKHLCTEHDQLCLPVYGQDKGRVVLLQPGHELGGAPLEVAERVDVPDVDQLGFHDIPLH